MQIDVITIFPELFNPFMDCSIVGRAIERKLLEVNIHLLRDFATDKHRTVDDTAYGGGPGMVMKPEPWFSALRKITGARDREEATAFEKNVEIILLSPRGERLSQKLLESFAQYDNLVFLCGRYEGIDDRVRQSWVTKEISLGDFVINGGELAAQVLIEGIVRLLPEALSDPESARQDSFSRGFLDHRHFTKPPEFENLKVPEVLLSGNHELIRKWRLRDSIEATYRRRPDLLKKIELSYEEKQILDEIVDENT